MSDLDGQEREAEDRLYAERAAGEMTQALISLLAAADLTRKTEKEVWAVAIERIAAEAKRIRDDMYHEQGAIQHV